MVPQMFCMPGMTTYRSLFDLLGVPYPGNGPDLMALTANKARARAVVAANRRACSRRRGRPIRRRRDGPRPAGRGQARGFGQLDGCLAGPRVRRANAPRFREALTYSPAALVETYVPLGREVRCGIIVRDGKLVCLPLEEYAVDSVRSSADKLNRTSDGDLYLVAKEQTRAWTVLTSRIRCRSGQQHMIGSHITGMSALRPVRLSHRPGRRAVVSRSQPLLLLFAVQRVGGDGLAAGITVEDLFAFALEELPVKRSSS